MARSKQSTKTKSAKAPKVAASKSKKAAAPVVAKEAVEDSIVVASSPSKKSPGKKAAAKKTTTEVVKKKEKVSDTPYQLDTEKTLRACTALKAYLEAAKDPSAKPNLLEDPDMPSASAVTIWLNLTTKKYISDTRKLKPSPIKLPHPLTNPTTTAILIVKEPQRDYKDLVATAGLSATITRVIDIAKLRAKFKSFESKRQLADSHDVFLADDRIVTMLPSLLGKSVYKRTAKVPIPITLTPSPAHLQKAVTTAMASTYLHLSPAACTSVRIALSCHSAQQMTDNIAAAVNQLTIKKIPGGWRNLRSLHIKSPESAALPIWLAEELYDENDVLQPGEAEAAAAAKEKEKEDRKARKVEKRNKRKSQAQDGGPESKKARIEENPAAAAIVDEAAPEPEQEVADEELEVEVAVPSDVEVEIEEEEETEKKEAEKKKAEKKVVGKKANKAKAATSGKGEKRKTRSGKRS